MIEKFTIPVVMSFSIHDPLGRVGIHPDIETLFSLSCRATAVVTGIGTENDTSLKNLSSVPTSIVIEQARSTLDKMPIAAFKIGIVNNIETIAAIHTILRDFPGVPVVCNITKEILGDLQNPYLDVATALTALICPLSTVLVTDKETAAILAPGADTIDACAHKLMEFGSEYVFIKGCDANSSIIKNSLYTHHRLLEEYIWERIPGNYIGCGCTLSAALTGFLAHGITTNNAVLEAQQYTLNCIQQGHKLGLGLKFLTRIFGIGHI